MYVEGKQIDFAHGNWTYVVTTVAQPYVYWTIFSVAEREKCIPLHTAAWNMMSQYAVFTLTFGL